MRLVRNISALTGKNPISLGVALASKAMVCLTLSTQRGATGAATLDALLVYLTNYTTPFSDIRLNDTAMSRSERVTVGGGWFTPVINGVRFFVKVTYKTDTDRPYAIANLYFFPKDRGRIEEVMDTINPIDATLPRVYIFPSNENLYFRSAAEEAFSGYVDRMYGAQEQLIDPELYARLDKIMYRFKNDPDYYRSIGRAIRECFLLYGPPGTGKTNLVRHFASKYELNMIICSPGRALGSVRSLAMNKLGRHKTIILMEDIHAHRALTIEKPTDTTSRLLHKQADDDANFSEFLNFLDGPQPLPNCAIFMTTNKLEALHDGIYRSGRATCVQVTYPEYSNILKVIGYPEGDERLKYLESLECKQLPLAVIVSLRAADTLEEVIEIISERDLYFKLSLESGDSTAFGKNNVKEEPTVVNQPLEQANA